MNEKKLINEIKNKDIEKLTFKEIEFLMNKDLNYFKSYINYVNENDKINLYYILTLILDNL